METLNWTRRIKVTRTYELNDVPETEVELQIEILNQDGAIEETPKPQKNGMY